MKKKNANNGRTRELTSRELAATGGGFSGCTWGGAFVGVGAGVLGGFAGGPVGWATGPAASTGAGMLWSEYCTNGGPTSPTDDYGGWMWGA